MKNRGTLEQERIVGALLPDPLSINELMQRLGLEKKYRQEVKAILVRSAQGGQIRRHEDGRFSKEV